MKYLTLLLLTGCMVGPNYKEPDVAMPTQYVEEEEAEKSDLANWWTQFDDIELNYLVREAITGNFDLKIAMTRIVESRALFLRERAELFPQVDANGNIDRLRFSQNLFESPFLGPAIQDIYRVGFDAIWELDIFGKLKRAQQAAYYDFEATRDEMRAVFVTLLSDVASTYVTIRSLQSEIKALNYHIEAQEEIVKLSADRERAGLDSGIDLADANALLKETSSEIYLLEESLKANVFSLANLLGRQPAEMLDLISEEKPIPMATSRIPAGLPSDLLRRRPDIRKAERELQAATSRVGVAIADLFPQFSLTGRFGFESNSTSNWFAKPSQMWRVGPSFSWPLIDFGGIRENIKAHKARQKEALLKYEQTILTALKEVETALVAYFKEEQRVKALSEEVASNEVSRNLKWDLYQAGLVDFSDFLDSEKRLLTSKQTYFTSERDLMVKLITFYKALGGEWPC